MNPINAAMHGHYLVRWWLYGEAPRWGFTKGIAFGFRSGIYEAKRKGDE